ncbi:MAG TPA: alpha/beta fold hydrolase [Pyrinomonadaceae bacterium]
MEPEKLIIQVNDQESVSALLYPAAKAKRARVTIVLGHGAGGNQLSGFMRLFGDGLASRGLDTMTFNFVYSEKGRGAPDPKSKLEACYLAAIEAALSHQKLKKNRLVIGGKSMGGRIASQVAANEAIADSSISHSLSGLVFLGYPLHPPGKPEQLRDQHLKDIHAPMLVIQGTRDPFGTSDELRAVIKRLRLAATLQPIEEGDHSFKVPKRVGTQDEVYGKILDRIAMWANELSG